MAALVLLVTACGGGAPLGPGSAGDAGADASGPSEPDAGPAPDCVMKYWHWDADPASQPSETLRAWFVDDLPVKTVMSTDEGEEFAGRYKYDDERRLVHEERWALDENDWVLVTTMVYEPPVIEWWSGDPGYLSITYPLDEQGRLEREETDTYWTVTEYDDEDRIVHTYGEAWPGQLVGGWVFVESRWGWRADGRLDWSESWWEGSSQGRWLYDYVEEPGRLTVTKRREGAGPGWVRAYDYDDLGRLIRAEEDDRFVEITWDGLGGVAVDTRVGYEGEIRSARTEWTAACGVDLDPPAHVPAAQTQFGPPWRYVGVSLPYPY